MRGRRARGLDHLVVAGALVGEVAPRLPGHLRRDDDVFPVHAEVVFAVHPDLGLGDVRDAVDVREVHRGRVVVVAARAGEKVAPGRRGVGEIDRREGVELLEDLDRRRGDDDAVEIVLDRERGLAGLEGEGECELADVPRVEGHLPRALGPSGPGVALDLADLGGDARPVGRDHDREHDLADLVVRDAAGDRAPRARAHRHRELVGERRRRVLEADGDALGIGVAAEGVEELLLKERERDRRVGADGLRSEDRIDDRRHGLSAPRGALLRS